MPRFREPIAHRRVELTGRHPAVRGDHHLTQPFVAVGHECLCIAIHDHLVRLTIAKLGMGIQERRDARKRVHDLDVHRLLAPQRAVVIKDGDAIGDGNKLLPGRVGDTTDEAHDDSLRRVVAPARKRIDRRGTSSDLRWSEPEAE
jgi:hypothetical protein